MAGRFHFQRRNFRENKMNHRQRALAILNYQDYDRLPVVHFGYWTETLEKWAREGHISEEEAKGWTDGNVHDVTIAEKLGFDFNWNSCVGVNSSLWPFFDEEVIEELPDGSQKFFNGEGVIVVRKPGAGSIPAEVDHLLKTRADWEEHYKHRLQFNEERILSAEVRMQGEMRRFDEGGAEFLREGERDYPLGIFCGSLFGVIRNIVGVVGVSYMMAEDPELYDEIIDTVGELCYRCTENMLDSGAKFDFAHFWEDICFKNGPLVIPSVFDEKVGPHYKRITDLCRKHGITIASLDCDGCIDALIPTWVENGVNTMFPIEVGTWNANITPWREKFGKELRGVGGMNKVVFSRDRAAIDAEIERLKPQIELGGFIPCPDHRIAPDGKWDNVRYYCEQMHKEFS
jgi:hypothetical protein